MPKTLVAIVNAFKWIGAMRKPKLLDLFCCAGGAGTGYNRAGFDVVGIDIMRQPHYPFEFHQADAFEYLLAHGGEFDVIHASPPCQRYSNCTPVQYRNNHPDLIAAIRAALRNVGKPYVIENVRGAMRLLERPHMLCGTMFGLNVRRHRYFEIYPRIAPPILKCDHSFYPVLISGTTRRKGGIRFEFSAQARRDATDLQWMTIKEMDEAIPPAYTEWIGCALIALLNL
jgi:DNA (cytosine-5)-methyltransferase 1